MIQWSQFIYSFPFSYNFFYVSPQMKCLLIMFETIQKFTSSGSITTIIMIVTTTTDNSSKRPKIYISICLCDYDILKLLQNIIIVKKTYLFFKFKYDLPVLFNYMNKVSLFINDHYKLIAHILKLKQTNKQINTISTISNQIVIYPMTFSYLSIIEMYIYQMW